MLDCCKSCKHELAIRESVVQMNTLETYCRNRMCKSYTHTVEVYPFSKQQDMERTLRLVWLPEEKTK